MNYFASAQWKLLSQSLACKLHANTKHPGTLGLYVCFLLIYTFMLWCENKIIHIVEKNPPYANEPN